MPALGASLFDQKLVRLRSDEFDFIFEADQRGRAAFSAALRFAPSLDGRSYGIIGREPTLDYMSWRFGNKPYSGFHIQFYWCSSQDFRLFAQHATTKPPPFSNWPTFQLPQSRFRLEGEMPFPAPWQPVAEDDDHFDAELRRELTAGHPLYDQTLKAIAARDDGDDVLFRSVSDPSELFIIHLTWKGEEPAPWPAYERVEGTLFWEQ
jgi:hypothetical protein